MLERWRLHAGGWSGVTSTPGTAAQLAEKVDTAITFTLAGTLVLTMCMSAAFVDVFPTYRALPVFIGLLLLHLLRHNELAWEREIAVYSVFLLFMIVQLVWTPDIGLSLNTLIPAVNFLVILWLTCSLFRYHHVNTVLWAGLSGFLLSAIIYTAATGFPFRFPDVRSYNAIAFMYTFGLFLAVLIASQGRGRGALMGLAFIVMAHVVATTSIKTSLGIVLAVIAAGLVYFRHTVRTLARNAILLMLLAAGAGYAAMTNEEVRSGLEKGVSRVSLGIDILRARESLPGYGSFDKRVAWQKSGLEGWGHSPVVGNGVESFRHFFGITSHSTPIDLLHNSGIIGLMLFYSLFFSVYQRVRRSGNMLETGTRALMFAALACFAFISLSGILHYNAFLAAVFGTCIGLDVRGRLQSGVLWLPRAGHRELL